MKEKVKITKQQEKLIKDYILWLADNPIPCNECIGSDIEGICDVCESKSEYFDKRKSARPCVLDENGNDILVDFDIQKLVNKTADYYRLVKQQIELVNKVSSIKREIRMIQELSIEVIES